MKALTLLGAVILFAGSASYAQQRGTVYGAKPDTTATQKASNVEAFMGKRTRINTTIKGMVTKVTKEKGGWFDIDAGGGKIIAAHFSTYDVTIPMGLKGHYIIAEGIAQKQFIADDGQHLAGDTVSGKKQHTTKVNPKEKVTFEVKGLMVE